MTAAERAQIVWGRLPLTLTDAAAVDLIAAALEEHAREARLERDAWERLAIARGQVIFCTRLGEPPPQELLDRVRAAHEETSGGPSPSPVSTPALVCECGHARDEHGAAAPDCVVCAVCGCPGWRPTRGDL